MEKSRPGSYVSRKCSKIICHQCKVEKPIWYFRVNDDTGERRTTCKLCMSKIRKSSKFCSDKRFKGVFDGLDWNSRLDLNVHEELHKIIEFRIQAVKTLILKEKEEMDRPFIEAKRTIADEIHAGNRAWRSIRRLARAPMPLNLFESPNPDYD